MATKSQQPQSRVTWTNSRGSKPLSAPRRSAPRPIDGTLNDDSIRVMEQAAGVENRRVSRNFPDKDDARCLLYVALSRAKKRVMLVLSRDNPSPLFKI